LQIFFACRAKPSGAKKFRFENAVLRPESPRCARFFQKRGAHKTFISSHYLHHRHFRAAVSRKPDVKRFRFCFLCAARSTLAMNLGGLLTTPLQSHFFFRCAVVNQLYCRSIPDRTNATPAMLHG